MDAGAGREITHRYEYEHKRVDDIQGLPSLMSIINRRREGSRVTQS